MLITFEAQGINNKLSLYLYLMQDNMPTEQCAALRGITESPWKG